MSTVPIDILDNTCGYLPPSFPANLKNLAQIKLLQHKTKLRLGRGYWQSLSEKINTFHAKRPATLELHTNKSTVEFNLASKLDTELLELQNTIINELIPWRVGPYSINNNFLDSEWRSHIKYDRVLSAISNLGLNLTDKIIFDLGCNNGYFSWRLLEHNPAVVLGFDPLEKALWQYCFLKGFYHTSPNIPILGNHNDLKILPNTFDVGLCLGVLYHRRDPFLFLKQLHNSLKQRATLILETLVIPGDENQVFSVPDRYCGMHNVYLIPTVSALNIWLIRNGFRSIEIVDLTEMNKNEQRRTNLAPFHSLADFLDPTDHAKSIEGYPSPLRCLLTMQVQK